MTTLRYKLFETLLQLTGAGKTIGKGLARGNIPSEKVPSRLSKRWVKSEFQGRDIFTCRPVGKGNGRIYIHQHGGAYVLGLNSLHFSMFTKLADMSGVTIVLPDYPLPPESSALGIIDWAAAHYASVVTNSRLTGRSVITGCSIQHRTAKVPLWSSPPSLLANVFCLRAMRAAHKILT